MLGAVLVGETDVRVCAFGVAFSGVPGMSIESLFVICHFLILLRIFFHGPPPFCLLGVVSSFFFGYPPARRNGGAYFFCFWR